MTVAVVTATNGARRCRVVDNAGRPSRNASCNLAVSAGGAYLIDLRQQRPSAYQGKTVTAGGATGRFDFTSGRGPCGCDQALASVNLNG